MNITHRYSLVVLVLPVDAPLRCSRLWLNVCQWMKPHPFSVCCILWSNPCQLNQAHRNYHAWLATIWSFLMTLKVWRIASGASICPPAVGEAQNAWLDSDYQAVGIVSPYIKEDLRTAVVSTYEDPIVSLALRTLVNLATLYAMTGPTSQFYLFRDIVNWRLGGKTHWLRLPISLNCLPSYPEWAWFSPTTSAQCCFALA